jgi:D-proline reductase (dithiol) PrdB
MFELSRKAIPYTPVEKPLNQLTVALVSSAGIHRRSDDPFNLEGDERFYVFPGDTPTRDLMVTHSHYDHSDADQDINCVFPLDRLRELAAEGFIKGVSNKHVGFMGFSSKLAVMYEQTAPAIAREVERSQAEAVVLTGG